MRGHRKYGMGSIRSEGSHRRTTVIADDGHQRTGLIIPHHRVPGWAELPCWKGEPKASDRKVRARIEHVFAQTSVARFNLRRTSAVIAASPGRSAAPTQVSGRTHTLHLASATTSIPRFSWTAYL